MSCGRWTMGSRLSPRRRDQVARAESGPQYVRGWAKHPKIATIVAGSRTTHTLKRQPDLVTDVEGVSYLIFECLTCGCDVALRLDANDRVNGIAIVSPEQQAA